jgi:hypothetical protein
MTGSNDPQLNVAIKQMLTEIKENGYKKPDRPSYPDRSKGVEIADDDK